MGRHLTLRETETEIETAVKYVDESTRRINLNEEDERVFEARPSRTRPNR